MNLEDLDPFVFSCGRSTKKTSSKRPLRIISAGSRSMRLAVAATNSPRAFSCIQVRKNAKMRPCSPPDSVDVMPISISSNQSTAGAMSSIILHACTNAPSGLPMAAGEDLDHVDAIERKLELRGDGFDAQALAAARDAHDEHALGHDLGAEAVAHLKQFAALQQPCLQALQAADFADAGAVGDVLDDAAAIDQQPFLLEQRRQRFGAQASTVGQRAAHRVARFIEREPLQSARELVQDCIADFGAHAGSGELLSFVAQKLSQLDRGRAAAARETKCCAPSPRE